MANENIVAGLFGMTPEMYQRQQYQQDLQQGYDLARLDPGAAARAQLPAGIGQLGRGIAGAMGIEDPQLKLISARNSIFQQIDQSNPESMLQGIKMLSQAGDQQGAMVLAEYYRKAQSEVALAQQRMAEKMTPEQRNAMAYAGSVAEKGTPQFNQIYQTTLQGLISKEKPDLTTPEQKNAKAFALQAGPEGSSAFNDAFVSKLEQFTTKPENRPLIKEIGVAANTREPVYTYQEGKNAPQQITFKTIDGKQTMVPYTGGVDRTTANTKVTVDAKGQEAFTVELAKDDAKEVKNARGIRDAAIGELGTLQKMQELNQQQLMSGSFATGRVGALNLLNTLGMTSSSDTNKLANSEQYTKVSGDLLLDKIKKLGTNPSNTDREFIAKIVPQLENSPQARQELVNFLVDKANNVISETTRLDTYARKNKGLEGFVPKVPLVGQTPNLSSMSTEDLLKIAKGQKP
jgi:hypothetical protein